jgi:hypothetical protein
MPSMLPKRLQGAMLWRFAGRAAKDRNGSRSRRCNLLHIAQPRSLDSPRHNCAAEKMLQRYTAQGRSGEPILLPNRASQSQPLTQQTAGAQPRLILGRANCGWGSRMVSRVAAELSLISSSEVRLCVAGTSPVYVNTTRVSAVPSDAELAAMATATVRNRFRLEWQKLSCSTGGREHVVPVGAVLALRPFGEIWHILPLPVEVRDEEAAAAVLPLQATASVAPHRQSASLSLPAEAALVTPLKANQAIDPLELATQPYTPPKLTYDSQGLQTGAPSAASSSAIHAAPEASAPAERGADFEQLLPTQQLEQWLVAGQTVPLHQGSDSVDDRIVALTAESLPVLLSEEEDEEKNSGGSETDDDLLMAAQQEETGENDEHGNATMELRDDDSPARARHAEALMRTDEEDPVVQAPAFAGAATNLVSHHIEANKISAKAADSVTKVYVRLVGVSARLSNSAASGLGEGRPLQLRRVTFGPVQGAVKACCRSFHETTSSGSDENSAQGDDHSGNPTGGSGGVGGGADAGWLLVGFVAEEAARSFTVCAERSHCAQHWTAMVQKAYVIRVERRGVRGKFANVAFRAYACVEFSGSSFVRELYAAMAAARSPTSLRDVGLFEPKAH